MPKNQNQTPLSRKSNPEAVISSWITALRSKNYKQGHGQLLTTAGRYCCLGVLADLALQAKVCKPNDLQAVVLTHNVTKWAGLASDHGGYNPIKGGDLMNNSLATDNDTGRKSFKKIADIIEGRPDGLFKKAKQPKQKAATPATTPEPPKKTVKTGSGKNASQREMAKAQAKAK